MLDQVVAAEQLAALGVVEDRVRRRVAGAVVDPSVRSRSASASPSAAGASTVAARAPARGTRVETDAQRVAHVLRDPVARHDALGEASSASMRLRRSRASHGASASSAATSAPERPREDLDQPDVVDVLVGEDDQLEVLDAPAVLGQRALQLVSALPEFGPVSTQRQRVVLDR